MNRAEKRKNLERVRGGGGDSEVSPEDLQEYQQAVKDVVLNVANYNMFRGSGYKNRYNLWQGQNDEGTKKGAVKGKEAFPYEGSADSRVWLVDTIIEEMIDLCMTALLRAQIECEPVGGAADPDKARKATVLLQWAVGRMGHKWLDQHEILLNYMFQDTPAVALMRFGWHSEPVIEMDTMTRDQLIERWMGTQAKVQDPQEDQQRQEEQKMALQMALDTPAGVSQEMDEFLESAIMTALEGIKPGRANKIADQLRKGEEAEYPRVTSRIGHASMVARRFGEDFFVPEFCREFEDYMWFETEWLSGSELRAKAKTGEWDKEFVNDVLSAEGVPAFPMWSYNYGYNGDDDKTQDLHKGEYQVVYVWHLSTNDDGVRGRYCCIMHERSKKTAYGRRLYREGASRWPAVMHRRESLDNYILNSRSVGDIAGPTQWLLKYMTDNNWNNADVSALPPIVSSGFSNKGDVVMSKLGHIPLDRPGSEVKFLNPPAFPASGMQMMDRLQAEQDHRWKRRAKEIDQGAIQTREERIVGKFLSSVGEELGILFDIVMHNMSDEDLQMIHEEGRPIAETMEEIEGRYDVRVRFNPMELDQEKMTKLFKVFLPAIKNMAPDPSIDLGEINRAVVRMAFPNLPAAVRPKNAGIDKEMRDEQHNLMLIRAGMMPAMDDSGKWNYQARADMYDKMEAQNQQVPAPWNPQTQIPQVWADMGPDKYGKLLTWREALTKMAEQYGANAQIGRSMVKGAQGVQAEPMEEEA